MPVVNEAAMPAAVRSLSACFPGGRLIAISTHASRIRIGTTASFATGIYGGYFGAAQGIILMSLLRFCFADDLQRINGLKNVLAGVANAVAAILFIAVADVAWEAAGLIAVGSVVGAQVGARYGRHIPSEVLRWIVVVGGAIVAMILLVTR